MKKTVKKTVARKPMMKSGGAKKSMRRYQDGGGDMPPMSPSSTTTTTPAKRTFADAYKENIEAGLNPRQAKKIAMVEVGVKEQKKRIDPNAVINAVGNTAGAVGNLVSSVRGSGSGSSPSAPPFKKGGAKKCAKCGGAMKKMAKGGSTLSGSAMKKARVQLYGIPQENMGTSGQYGKMQKGGTTNRAVMTSCKGGLVRDASGKCVMERKMAKGGAAGKSKYQDGGKFNVTGKKPFESTGSKIGLGAGIAGMTGIAGKAIADAVKNRRNRKKQQEIEKQYMNKTQQANQQTANELNSMGEGYKRGGAKRMQKGGFPDLNKDGKVTRADILKGRGVIKKKGGATKAHPGFKAVQSSIAAKQGISKQAAGAILASSTRKASAKAKRANPRLKRVKG